MSSKVQQECPTVVLREMLDITSPEAVEITMSPDGHRVWVNVDGVCRLRACRVKELTITPDASGVTGWLTDAYDNQNKSKAKGS